jgi:cation:H+ antiporter
MTETAMPVLAFAAGFAILAFAAELLVKGAVGLADKMGVSPIVTGLTIVAFGTSAPELSVSIIASISGSPDLTTGNIVGSNIANIGLVLGSGAMIAPIILNRSLMTVELPFLLLSGLAAWFFSWSGLIGRVQGGTLLAAFCLYLWSIFIKKEKKDLPDEELEDFMPEKKTGTFRLVLYVIAGAAGLVGGSKLLVWGAVVLARYAGISELVIGLTMTAAGTSLPELAATVVAARKGHGDIAIGNVIGSNLANICGVLGPVAMITPIHVNSQVIWRDFPAMMLFTLVLLGCFAWKKPMNRVTGTVLLLMYASYITCISIT